MSFIINSTFSRRLSSERVACVDIESDWLLCIGSLIKEAIELHRTHTVGTECALKHSYRFLLKRKRVRWCVASIGNCLFFLTELFFFQITSEHKLGKKKINEFVLLVLIILESERGRRV